MNIHYIIKNFRTFDEKGAEIDIAPITILTGCNSSGKSSITKSLLLLGDFCEKLYTSRMQNASSRIDFSKSKMDLQQNTNLSLGTFDKVINEDNSNGKITFEYRMHSHYIASDIIVRMNFSSDKSENSKNGYLTSYTISDKDDHVLFSSEEHGLHYDNLNLLFHAFNDYYQYYLLRRQMGDLIELNRKNGSIKKKVDEKKREIEEFLKDKSDTLVSDLSFCMRYGKLNEVFNDNADVPLQKLKEEGTLFYLNNWTWFKSLTPENITEEIAQKIDSQSQGNKFVELVNLVINDFSTSSEANFIDYYLNKEADFLEERYPSEDDDYELRSYYAIFIHQDFCDDKDEQKFIILPDGRRIDFLNPKSSEKEDSASASGVDFDMVYQMAATIDYLINDADNEYYYPIHGKKLRFEHRLLPPFNGFAKRVSDEALSPLFFHNIRYVSTSRVSVQRIYTYQSNEFSKLIEEYIENKRDQNIFDKYRYEYDSFINKWIKALGIGESIKLEIDEEGIGTKIKLNKAGSTRLLADEGYGVTQLVSILLQIEVAIQKNNFYSSHPIDMDFHEINRRIYREDNIIIEEPEIHLHPKYQSLLADMLTDAYLNYNVHFIVETHSEYLIRRLQNIVGDTNSGLLPKDISINYIYSKDDPEYNSNNPIKRINLRSDGRLEESFGKGFFDEADRQVDELLNRKVERHGRFSKK